MTEFFRKHPVFGFYLLAFLLSWLGRVPLMLSSYGLFTLDNPPVATLLFGLGGVAPTLAAVIMIALLKSGESLFAPFRRWRVGVQWYLIALLAPFPVMVLALYIAGALPGGLAPNRAAMEWAGLPFLFLSMFLSYVWEEIGWRGFALPRLQQRYSALVASLIMGALAFLWHLPLTFNRDLPAALPTTPAGLLIDLVFAIAITVWYTWLYNNSGGSLWPVSIFHAALNTSAGVTMAVAGAEGFTAQYVPATLIYTALAILITLAYGPATLTRRVRAESAPSRAA